VNDGADTRDTLIERADLVNPQRRRRPSELFTDTRPGTNRTGSLQYAFDDHRQPHTSDIDEEFARMTMTALRALIDERPTRRAIICASPRMLGRLRAAAPELLPGDVTREERPRDLVKLSPVDAWKALASRGLLPRAQRAQHERVFSSPL
jgi:protein required for attachment to host cells